MLRRSLGSPSVGSDDGEEKETERSLDYWIQGVLSAIKSTASSEKEFRKMTVIVFSILLSALVVWLIYFIYLMLGDFFTGAFLALIVSIPLERKKKEIIQNLSDRITAHDSYFKTTRNALLFQWFSLCYSSAFFFSKNSRLPFTRQLALIWNNVVSFIKGFIAELLGDIISLSLAIFVNVTVLKSPFPTSLIIMGTMLLCDILLRLFMDFSFYCLGVIHRKLFPLFDSEHKPTPGVTYAVSTLLVITTIIGIMILIGILVAFVILEVGDLKEFGSYVYGILETWLKQSNIANYLNGNDEVITSVRRFAEDYGADIKEKFNIPINLTSLINGTKEEVQHELIRDANLLMNSTFALDTGAIYEIVQGSEPATLASFASVIHNNLSKFYGLMAQSFTRLFSAIVTTVTIFTGTLITYMLSVSIGFMNLAFNITVFFTLLFYLLSSGIDVLNTVCMLFKHSVAARDIAVASETEGEVLDADAHVGPGSVHQHGKDLHRPLCLHLVLVQPLLRQIHLHIHAGRRSAVGPADSLAVDARLRSHRDHVRPLRRSGDIISSGVLCRLLLRN